MKAYPIMFKHPTTGAIIENQGMELRDWFAGKALMSMLSAVQDITESTPSTAAKYAYKFADAMIKARENKDE